MSQSSIFADEWRDCLREHYMYVIREHDEVTRPTLTKVMTEAGFTDSELAELRVRATMRADEMPENFVPDLDVLEATIHAVPEIPVPEVAIVEELIEDELPIDEVAVPEVEEAEAEEEIEKDDPDAPKQLSLF